MATDSVRERVFIYCDDPSHAVRRVAVANFRRLAATAEPGSFLYEHRWKEVHRPTGIRRGSLTELDGVELIQSDPERPEEWESQIERQLRGEEVGLLTQTREVYTLKCRRCPRRPVSARAENLYSILDAFVTRGLSEASLAFVAASLEALNRTRSTPPPGSQGQEPPAGKG